MAIVLITILLFPLLASAVQVAPRITDKEIVEKLTRLEEGQKGLNKRIDDVNKRIDGLEKSLNRRIDDVNNRIDDVNNRIDGLEKSLNGRIDDVNKRIDGLEKSLNRRIDDLRVEMNDRFSTLQWMLGLFITISLVILGFVLRMQWQMQRRQTRLEATLNAHREEINFLKNLIEKLLPPKGAL